MAKLARGSVALLAAMLVTSCTDVGEPTSEAQNAVGDSASIASNSAIEAKPAPHYLGQSGRIYFYRNPDGGDPVGFVYRGKNRRGLNIILLANRNGTAQEFAGCTDPCGVIITEMGKLVPYDETSLVGTVFEDIGNGFLKPVVRHPW